MKKHWIISIIALLGVAGYYFTVYQNEHPQTDAAVGQAPAIIKIGITQMSSSPMSDQIKKGITDGFKAAGYEEHKTITYDFENASGDQALWQSIGQKFASSDLAIVMPIGREMGKIVANVVKQKPIVFGAVTDPVSAGLVSSVEHPGANATGTSDPTSVQKQLDLLKKLIPKAKNVGIIFNPNDADNTFFLQQAKTYAGNLKIEILAVPFTAGEIASTTKSLAKKADTLMLLPHTSIPVQEALIHAALATKTALIGADESSVQKGAIAAWGVDYYQIGLQTAEIAVQILHGKKPGDIPVSTVTEANLFINTATAKKIELRIPEDLLSTAKKLYK